MSVSADQAAWRTLQTRDLPAVCAIAGDIHPDLSERPEVFAEKLILFPAGCFAFELDGEIAGYAFAHPWRTNGIPKLDTLLGAIPDDADCLYLHDVALLPKGRGRNAVAQLLAKLVQVAQTNRLHKLALVSVYGTHALWARYGFAEIADMRAQLHSYGETACYMIKAV